MIRDPIDVLVHFVRSKIIPKMFRTGDKCEVVDVNAVWARAEVIEHKDEFPMSCLSAKSN